jgi:hypothetical protein
VQHRVALRALAHVGGDLGQPQRRRGVIAVEAVGEPVGGAVEEHDHRREHGALGHVARILRDQRRDDDVTRLGAAVDPDHVEAQRPAHDVGGQIQGEAGCRAVRLAWRVERLRRVG